MEQKTENLMPSSKRREVKVTNRMIFQKNILLNFKNLNYHTAHCTGAPKT
jgi:hypothetical protein